MTATGESWTEQSTAVPDSEGAPAGVGLPDLADPDVLRGALDNARAQDVPILYGGSVKAANAPALFAMADVDGGLVGGASLDAVEFLAIARA